MIVNILLNIYLLNVILYNFYYVYFLNGTNVPEILFKNKKYHSKSPHFAGNFKQSSTFFKSLIFIYLLLVFLLLYSNLNEKYTFFYL